MTPLQRRIEEAAENVGGVPKLAEKTGIKRNTIYGWIKGPTEPRASDIIEIARVAGRDVSWLLTGEHSPGSHQQQTLVSSYDPDEQPNGWSAQAWQPHIKGARPELDVRLGAGEGQVGEIYNMPVAGGTASAHRVVAEWLIPAKILAGEYKASVASTVIMEIVGESMMPHYLPGDRVIVDLSQRNVGKDGVFSIAYDDGEPQIKALQRVPFSDPPTVSVISYHDSWPNRDVPLERLTVHGRVCGVISRR